MEKNYLPITFSFVHGSEGDRAISASSASRNTLIDASRSLLEAQMELDFMQLEDEVQHFAHGKKTTCLHFLPLFVVQRATRQRCPLLQVETGRLMLPDCLWKRKWNMTSCSWKSKLGTFHTKKNYLLALFIFVHGVEDDEATSPSFAAENAAIEASSSSLEALIATRCSRGDANGSTLCTASKNLFADLEVFTSGEGNEATSPSFAAENTGIDASSSSLEVLIATL